MPDHQLYAHSVKNKDGSRKDKSHWETLQEHLDNVAGRCVEFAARFGAEDCARVVALLHDLGKAKPAFQDRLEGKKDSEPHTGEGALYARDEMKEHMGKLLAYCVAGHHTGLPNGVGRSNGNPQRPLTDRLSETNPIELPEWLKIPFIKTVPTPLQAVKSDDPARFFKLHFFTRMLFSALVDADYLETERFYDKVEGRDSQRASTATLAGLAPALEKKLAGFGEPTSPVNRLRAEILAHVRKGAAQAPGLFSLTVPTGGGKTLASLAFALDHAKQHGLERVIYVIPYTSIVEQTAGVFREALGDEDAVLEHHASFDWEKRDDTDESERSSLRLAAENWDRPVVVTTTVQFFESLFANRTAKCRKLHRLAKSVIILDEAQTLPPHVLRPCLAAIKELAEGYGASLVLCTATQPALLKEDGFTFPEWLAKKDVRELAPNPPKLYQQLRRVQLLDAGTLDDTDLAQRIADSGSVLVILNNRRHAREIFDNIRCHGDAYHLTTSMTPNHRRAILAKVRDRLEKNLPVRLVATSLVEAGVDIDFPTVYRAMAGIDSIAQAAGRCNREGKMAEFGRIFIFRPDTEHKPPPELQRFADEGAKIIARHKEDALSLAAVRDYFRLLYWNRAGDLDSSKVGPVKGIMKSLSESERSDQGNDLPFADIAQAFHLIDDSTLPVIICDGKWGVPEQQLKAWQFLPYPGSIARKLQPFQVQVPMRIRDKMLCQGAARVWRKDFGEQFVLLANADMYDGQAGLRVDRFMDRFEDFGYWEI